MVLRNVRSMAGRRLAAAATVLTGALIFWSAAGRALAMEKHGPPVAAGKQRVPSNARIVVAVQTRPGSALVDEEKDPYRGTDIWAVDPDAGTAARVVEKAAQPRLSADGRTMVYVTAKGIAVRSEGHPSRLVRPLAPERTALVLSADGQVIIYSVRRSLSGEGLFSYDSWRCTMDGGKPTKLPIPDTDQVIDWSPDGRWLLTLRWPRGGGNEQLYRMRPDGKDQRQLSQSSGLMSMSRFSPDGRRIVYMHQDRGRNALWVMDADGRHRTKIVDYRPDWHPWASWSPDGRHLAVVDCKPPHGSPPTDYHLDIMDADGKNRRTLRLPKALWIGMPVWR